MHAMHNNVWKVSAHSVFLGMPQPLALGCAGLVLGCGVSGIHMLVNEFVFAFSERLRGLEAKVQMRHYVPPMPFVPVL